MSKARHCPECGTELPAAVSAEMCPKCLMRAALKDDSKSEPNALASGKLWYDSPSRSAAPDIHDSESRATLAPQASANGSPDQPETSAYGSTDETIDSEANLGLGPEDKSTDRCIVDQTLDSDVKVADAVASPERLRRGAKVKYFGDYEIIEEIARGGMGVVYKARQVTLNRIVALKMILSGQLASEDDVKRFHTEAEAAANLDHPGIVPIYEVGQHEEQHYFSMGFVEGQSLADRLKDGPLPARKAAELTKKVAEAVAYAHEHGVIHRDLKPANVPLERHEQKNVSGSSTFDFGLADLRPKITDFGLAKRSETDSGLTATGQILGTPSYMPPEQAAGKTDETGPLADVYSLGATLYATLTGRPPFQAATLIDTLKQVLDQEPVSPRALDAAVSRDLETICLKCLEKEPAKRYATAEALANELGCYLRGEPIRARPISRAARVWRWCKRKPVVAGLVVAVVVCLLAGTSISAYFAIAATFEERRANAKAEEALTEKQRADAKAADALREKQRADDKAEEAFREKDRADEYAAAARAAKERADQEAAEARRQAERAEWQLYSIHISTAQREWQKHDGVAAWRHLNACREDLRGWEHDYLHALFTSGQTTLEGHNAGVSSVAFSPDGQRIVSGSGDKTLKVWDVATGHVVLTLEGHGEQVCSVAFSPDGRQVVSGSGDKTLKVWDIATRRTTLTLTGHTEIVWSVAFSPDGKRIVSGSRDNTARVWDAATGQEVLTFDGHSAFVNAVAFSLDGKRIVSVSSDNTLKVWDAAGLREMATLTGHTEVVMSAAFSPDGRQIVSGSGDKTVKIWGSAGSQEFMTLDGHGGDVTCVAFGPNGNRIVSGSSHKIVKVWNAATGQETMTLAGHDRDVTSVAISPDGQWIASGSLDQTARVWDAASGHEILTFDGHSAWVNSVAFSPDGKWIVSSSRPLMTPLPEPAAPGIRPTRSKIPRVSRSETRGVADRYETTLVVWDAATGQEAMTLKGHRGGVNCAAFSPDGRQIVSGSEDATLKLWNAETGQDILTIEGPAEAVTSVAFSPDGTRIVSSSEDATPKVWDATTGQEILALKGHAGDVNSVAYSPDGTRIVSVSDDRTLKVWNATTGQETLTLEGLGRGGASVAVSPDGTRIVSGSRSAIGARNNAIRVWDASVRAK